MRLRQSTFPFASHNNACHHICYLSLPSPLPDVRFCRYSVPSISLSGLLSNEMKPTMVEDEEDDLQAEEENKLINEVC